MTRGWNLSPPDTIISRCRRHYRLPARGDIESPTKSLPRIFRENRWVADGGHFVSNRDQLSSRGRIHSAPDSKWLRMAPVGVPFTAGTLRMNEGSTLDAAFDRQRSLMVSRSSSSPEIWQRHGQFHPCGSDLGSRCLLPHGPSSIDSQPSGCYLSQHPRATSAY